MKCHFCRGGAHRRCDGTVAGFDEACACACRQGLKPATGTEFTVGIEWCDPPKVLKRTSPLVIAAGMLPELHDHPKRWGRIAVYATKSSAANARHVLARRYPDFEFTTRVLDPATLGQGNRIATGLWGRYLGDPT